MSQTYESRILDHLGLVAGMCDELGLSDQIDGCIAQDTEQRRVSVGKAVKAMILNGLGFTEQRLYLTPQFFATKPTERLIGAGIKPEHLNDDALGRASTLFMTTGSPSSSEILLPARQPGWSLRLGSSTWTRPASMSTERTIPGLPSPRKGSFTFERDILGTIDPV